MDHQSHQTTGSHAFRVVSVLEVGRDYLFLGISCGLGAWRGTRLLVSGDSVWSRCLKWDETTCFKGIRVVSVLGEGRDCWFSWISCGLGAGRGTRLLISGESVLSRCQSRDETIGFQRFRVVSVLEVGTRLSVSNDSVWSRCRKWDETTCFREIRVVSVLEVGRDCRFSGISCGLGAGRGTRLLALGNSVWSRCWKRDETAGFRGFRVVSVPGVGRDHTDCGCRGEDGPRNLYARSLPPASSRGSGRPIVCLFAF